MAALDLHRGVDPAARVWGGGCSDLLDSFDSEIEQWEEQLQEVQKKIEELYKVVEARRSTIENIPGSNPQLDITLLAVDDAVSRSAARHRDGKVKDIPAHQNGLTYPCNYPDNARTPPANYDRHGLLGSQSRVGDRGRDETLDILDGYLGASSRLEPCANANFGGNPSFYSSQNGCPQWMEAGGIGYPLAGDFEEALNQKNDGSFFLDEPRGRHVSWKDPLSTPEKSVSKPPIKQRDAPHVPVRPAHFSESPLHPDRRCPLVDRKCSSPSVLRKFGAMLQENEGKTLAEDGTVTTVVSTTGPMSPKVGGNRVPKRLPIQKCSKDSEVPLKTSQNVEHRGLKVAPQPSQRSGQGAGVHPDPAVERLLGNCATPQYQVKCHSVVNQRSAAAPQQASGESPSLQTRRSFSRPARPANQRPPSRWASQTPTNTADTPLGPRSRSLSPAYKTQQRFNHRNKLSSYTETVIM